jgi:RNA polymerase sigma-70 factor, ECF subfamily
MRGPRTTDRGASTQPRSGLRIVSQTATADPLETASDDDATFVIRFRNQEAGAGEALWQRFLPDVRAIVRRLWGPKPEQDDLVQEVFLRFFMVVGRLRKAESVRSFIFGICVRVVNEEIRRRMFRRWLSITPASVPHLPTIEGGDHDAREAVRRLYDVLDSIGGQARSLYVVRHIEGKELTEVASVHGISLSSAQRKLARVEKRVAAMVENDPLLSEYASTVGQGGLS